MSPISTLYSAFATSEDFTTMPLNANAINKNDIVATTVAINDNPSIDGKYVELRHLLLVLSKRVNKTSIQQISKRLEYLTATMDDALHANLKPDKGNVIHFCDDDEITLLSNNVNKHSQ